MKNKKKLIKNKTVREDKRRRYNRASGKFKSFFKTK